MRYKGSRHTEEKVRNSGWRYKGKLHGEGTFDFGLEE